MTRNGRRTANAHAHYLFIFSIDYKQTGKNPEYCDNRWLEHLWFFIHWKKNLLTTSSPWSSNSISTNNHHYCAYRVRLSCIHSFQMVYNRGLFFSHSSLIGLIYEWTQVTRRTRQSNRMRKNKREILVHKLNRDEQSNWIKNDCDRVDHLQAKPSS